MNKFTVFALFLTLTASAAAQSVYRWVDDDGVVHYGARPPQGVDATLVSTASPASGLGVPAEEIRGEASESTPADEEAEISYAEQRRRDRMKRQEEARKEQAERQSECTAMERERAALEPSTRVIIEDENGNPIRMDDNDRLTRLEEAKKYLAENCQ